MALYHEMQNLIDVTGFKTVEKHLARDPQITGILNVGDQDLAEVARICVVGDTKAFEALYTEGKISAAPIDSGTAVEVIYLPPLYLFKSMHKPYV